VQASRDLVAPSVTELAAGVQGRQDHLGRRLADLGMPLNGDSAAVVHDGAAVVGVKGDRDLLGVSGDGFVHGVVHNLVDEVVESAGAGRPDVHAGALADGLEPLEDGDVLGAVAGAAGALLRGRLLLGCGARAARTGGCLLAGSSALGGLRHSASFQSDSVPRPS